METKLPEVLTQALPAPTPQHAQSLSPEQLEDHRQKIAFDVEVVLDGYWDKRPPEHVKAGILSDWADTLEDWTQPQVLYGLRKWRNENPNKKPNPSHILAILKKTRGQKEVERRRVAEASHENPRKSLTDEQRAERKRQMDKALADLAAKMAR